VTDPGKGRPDIDGTDPMGSRRLIIGAEFWAGPAAKLPGVYLTMLSPGKPGVVLVVAPVALPGIAPSWPLLAGLRLDSGADVGEALGVGRLWGASAEELVGREAELALAAAAVRQLSEGRGGS